MNMSTLKASISVFICLCLGGCEGLTRPDGDQLEELANAISTLPADEQAIVTRSKEHDRAMLFFDGGSDQDHLAVAWCEEDATKRGPVWWDEVRAVFTASPDWGVGALKKYIEEQAAKKAISNARIVNKDAPCTPKVAWTSTGKERLDRVREERGDDPESLDSAKWLVALKVVALTRMPALMGVLGITAGAGGIMIALDGIGLVLCPLSAAVACPDDPGAPGVPQPGPGPGPGGDR